LLNVRLPGKCTPDKSPNCNERKDHDDISKLILLFVSCFFAIENQPNVFKRTGLSKTFYNFYHFMGNFGVNAKNLDFLLHDEKIFHVFTFRANSWSRRSLGSYSLSAHDIMTNSQLQLDADFFFHVTLNSIESYLKVRGIYLELSDYINAIWLLLTPPKTELHSSK
jgi:hypothetical protein